MGLALRTAQLQTHLRPPASLLLTLVLFVGWSTLLCACNPTGYPLRLNKYDKRRYGSDTEVERQRNQGFDYKCFEYCRRSDGSVSASCVEGCTEKQTYGNAP